MKTKLLVSSLFALFVSASVNAQWFQQTSGTVAALSSIHCANSTNCMVVGTTTTVRKTTDGGATPWGVTGTNGITNKLFVKMKSVDTVMIGQDNGTAKKTTNNGTNWSTDIFLGNSNFDVFDIAFTSSTNMTVVGGSPTNHVTGGHITSSSTDKGLTFPTFVNVSGEPTFFGIEALTTTTFVACGGNASVYKTIDGGANWTSKLTGTPSTTTLYDIHFPVPATNSTIGYAVGGNGSAPATGGVVYKTTDGGETWVSASTGLLPNAIFGVHFVSVDTGYVVGDGGKIQYTIDGGANWATQISPVTTTLNKIYFPTNKIGYICGASGVILKTTSGGFIAPLVVNAGSDASLCNGSCTTLGGAGIASGGTTPYTYSWSPAAGSTSSLVVCPSVTTTYTVTVTDVNSNVKVDSVTVTIFSYPAISISGLNSVNCNLASSYTLSGTPSGGTFSGPGVTAGVFDPSMAGVGTHTITYTFTDANTGCSLSGTTTTTVLALPSPVPLCMVTVDSSINNTSNIVVWDKPVTTTIDSFHVYRMGPSSTYTLIASLPYSADSKYVDNSAAADPKAQPHEYAISVIDTCGIESAKSASDSTMHLGVPAFALPGTFTLNWTDFDGFGFLQYEVWKTVNNGGTWTKEITVAYAASPTVILTAQSKSSRYRIRATAPGNCNTGTDVFKYSLSNATNDYTGINEITLNSWLNVYPNPNHGTFKVEMSGTGFEVKGMNVYNMLGELIYQSSGKNMTSEISIAGITPGIYQLEVITDMGTANKKITIE